MASEHTGNFTALPGHGDPLTSCKDEDFLQLKSYLSIFYSLIFLVCFPGNIVTIFIYFVKMRPWKSSTIIMLNLAITDLLYIATLPFFIHYSANGNNWIFGDFMYKFIHFCFYFNMYSGIIFLICFSIFRFFVVVHPIKCFFVQKQRWAVVTCVVVWIISLVAISPLGILITTRHTPNRTICPDLATAEDLDTSRWYNWVLTMFAAFLPLLTVTLCYALIIYTLATGPHVQACYKQKARILAVLLLAVFYVCFLPFHVFRGIRLELRVRSVSCHLKNRFLFMSVVAKPLAALNTFGNTALCSDRRQLPAGDPLLPQVSDKQDLEVEEIDVIKELWRKGPNLPSTRQAQPPHHQSTQVNPSNTKGELICSVFWSYKLIIKRENL